MKDDELKGYYAVYTDCWKMFRKYSNPVADDSFWDELQVAADEIYRKHGNSKFSEKIVLATVLEIERIYKDLRKE